MSVSITNECPEDVHGKAALSLPLSGRGANTTAAASPKTATSPAMQTDRKTHTSNSPGMTMIPF